MGGVVATASLLEFLPTLPDSQDPDTTVCCSHSNYLTERTSALSVIAARSCASSSCHCTLLATIIYRYMFAKGVLVQLYALHTSSRIAFMSVHNVAALLHVESMEFGEQSAVLVTASHGPLRRRT
ncbi:hypothetical protein ABBQ38_009788 [Trebouxia sp. C0009 RCD-2024]